MDRHMAAAPATGVASATNLKIDMGERKLNLGCGLDVRPESEGWTNMDAFAQGPGVLRHDMTRTPWPFEDDSFDYVLASHVLEHVPPLFVEEDGVQRDVLFRIFEELHRVLRVGGILHIKVPYGNSGPAVAHIQHYRQWRPEWFHYFEPEHTENYYSHARFRVDLWQVNRVAQPLPHSLRIGRSRIPLTSHLRERVPWLYRLLQRPGEIEVLMRKLPLDGERA